MAKDGLSMKLEGGLQLDRALAKMAVTHQSKSSKVVNDSLKTAAAGVKKIMKPKIPKYHKDTKGFRTKSRNTTMGQLRRSLKSGLRKQNFSRSVFMAGVWFAEGKSKNKKSDDGFFAKWLYDNPHKDNAFGFSGGRTLGRIVKPASSGFNKTVGTQLATKIAALSQKIINKEL